jgi:multiple sugar transport system permease protein
VWKSDTGRRWLVYGGFLPFLVFAVFPFYWMAVTSLKSNEEIYGAQQIPLLIRKGVTFDHYRYVFRETLFARWMVNSLVVAGTATLASAGVSTLAAYALARLRFRGSQFFGMAIFITYLVPPTLLFIPLSRVVASFGIGDSPWALIVTYPTFLVPFCTWLLMGYFKTIPREMEESAMVDGANRVQAMVRIVLPLAAPGVLTAVMFAFTLSWGHFIYALAFISSNPQKMVNIGLATELIRGDVFYWGSLMAGALLTSLPIVVLYGFFAKRYVSGLTAGAVKA